MKIVTTIGGAVSGLVMGVLLVFLACVTTVMIVSVTRTDASIPYLIDASAAPSDGAAGVEFLPNGVGMLVFIAVCVGLGGGVAWARSTFSSTGGPQQARPIES